MRKEGRYRRNIWPTIFKIVDVNQAGNLGLHSHVFVDRIKERGLLKSLFCEREFNEKELSAESSTKVGANFTTYAAWPWHTI